jgi:arylsulfatase A-like enzyme
MFFLALANQDRSDKRPNILVIMGDDVGWFNIGAYHRGIMSGKTPNPAGDPSPKQ